MIGATAWDPELYLEFADERSRPFRDLLARVAVPAPRRIVDLGCGPGTLTRVLAARWPDAVVEALDSSAEMVAAARAGGVDARQVDVADWTPPADADLVVGNAVLHWVPGHLDLLPRWLAALPSGGWFAFQVPANFDEPSHTTAHALAAEPPWRGRFAVPGPDTVPGADRYAAALAPVTAGLDVWETVYRHRLTGPDPVLRWISSTVLRSARDALDEDGYARFRAELAPRLAAAYPPEPDGTTWFPFRRIFVVCRAPG